MCRPLACRHCVRLEDVEASSSTVVLASSSVASIVASVVVASWSIVAFAVVASSSIAAFTVVASSDSDGSIAEGHFPTTSIVEIEF